MIKHVRIDVIVNVRLDAVAIQLLIVYNVETISHKIAKLVTAHVQKDTNHSVTNRLSVVLEIFFNEF